MHVLVVEDDRRLATALRRGLAEEGVAVDWVEDGEEAVSFASATQFDAIVLDIMLQGSDDGFAVCGALRDRRVHTPVLILTARDAIDDRVRGLEAGADDYLVKPFALRELVARVRALARRHLDGRQAVLQAGALRLDTTARTAAVLTRALRLTAKELNILEYFMHHSGQVLTRSQVEQHVWNYDLAPASNLVEVYIGRIRHKLADAGATDPFVTVRGEGYRFEPPDLCDASSDVPASV
jgi:DNA-binding response OmpR family regulator